MKQITVTAKSETRKRPYELYSQRFKREDFEEDNFDPTVLPQSYLTNPQPSHAFVYICNAVTIEDGVMVSAGTIFTNDRTPRATTPDLLELRTSDPDEHTKPTLVREGATIGARCVIGCDLTIGRFAMIGMGSVVTRSVPDFHLVVGQPAQFAGYVCRCGNVLVRYSGPSVIEPQHITTCSACARAYSIDAGNVHELAPPVPAMAG